MDGDELRAVVRAEKRLLDPQVRADPSAVDALLHPDFVEFGASGRVWDRASLTAALTNEPGVSGTATDFAPVALGPDAVLLTYRVDGPHGAQRSSVWLRDGSGRWRLRFHQGTRSPSPPAATHR